MHTGHPNPQSINNEYISGKIVINNSINNFMFPAVNVSNNFATIDYEAHIITKTDYTIKQFFRPMTVQKLNTLIPFVNTVSTNSSTCWIFLNDKSQ